MDRNDARFVADSIDSLINGDRESLDRVAATEVVRLMHCAATVRRISENWPPALMGAVALEDIARYGGTLYDGGEGPPATMNLIIFVDKMRQLAGEPELPTLPRNRAERRAQSALLPRAERVA